MKIKTLILIGVAALLATVSVEAQTTNVANQLSSQLPAIPVPAGASLPAFNTNGLDFTNANFKIATGSQFNSSGGVLSYWQFDADLHSFTNAAVDIGAGANATLSATGTGFHAVAGFGELLKNFSNFQLVGKVGAGGDIDQPAFYGAEVAELNYNLTSGTSGILANNHLFTYVGANIEADEGNFQTGGKFQKQFNLYAGVAF